jgi:hypothetical protein
VVQIMAHSARTFSTPRNRNWRNMPFRHEVLHIRRQKQRLIDIPGTKILAHSPTLNQTRSELNSDYSDRLLGVRNVLPMK